jgi:hypothetical protein
MQSQRKYILLMHEVAAARRQSCALPPGQWAAIVVTALSMRRQ